MDRAERIGKWVSGVGHVGLIGWAALGGALFGPQPSPPLQMTQVATMSEAEFQDFAAASRGAGPLSGQAQDVAALPQPSEDNVQSGALEAVQSPEPETEIQPLPVPDASENAPDLTELTAAPQAPVSVATALPQPSIPEPVQTPDEQPQAPQPAVTPQPETALAVPEAPQSPATPDNAVQAPVQPAPPPRSELALDNSPRPRGRPDGLVENRNRRLAEAAEAARRQAEADEARREAEAQAEREAAEAERQARARSEAEAARAAEEAAERQAEESRRQAEQDRLAAEEAERQEQERQEQAREEAESQAAAEAERQREEQERVAAEEAEAAERERQAAEQTERDRIAAEEAERALQEAAAAEQAVRDAEAAAEVARQRAEEAAPSQDALSAALSEALGEAPSDASGPATDGPPLSLSEREGFRLAINQCWNIGTQSREAQATTVSVAFSMSPDGMPEPGTMRLMGHSGGSPAAAQQAYDFARRAIIACAGTGYALPPEKYNRWKEVIIDFRPDGVGVQ